MYPYLSISLYHLLAAGVSVSVSPSRCAGCCSSVPFLLGTNWRGCSLMDVAGACRAGRCKGTR